jgi:hypothetical protein
VAGESEHEVDTKAGLGNEVAEGPFGGCAAQDAGRSFLRLDLGSTCDRPGIDLRSTSFDLAGTYGNERPIVPLANSPRTVRDAIVRPANDPRNERRSRQRRFVRFAA